MSFPKGNSAQTTFVKNLNLAYCYYQDNDYAKLFYKIKQKRKIQKKKKENPKICQ